MPGTQAARAGEGSAMPNHSHPHVLSVLHTVSEPTTLAVQPAVLQCASCTVIEEHRGLGDKGHTYQL